MTYNKGKFTLCFIALFFVLFAFFLYGKVSTHSDFHEFYGAASALMAGKNPFDPAVMLSFQKEILKNSDLDTALMLWTPPWILSVMAPWGFQYSYAESLFQWQIFSLILIGASILLLQISVFPESRTHTMRQVTTLCVALLCAPLLDAVKLSQTTAIFIFAVALSVYASKKNSFFVYGLAAALFMLKPHLFLLIFVICFFHAANNRALVLAVSGLSAGLCLLILASELSYPGGTRYWLETLLFTEEGTSTVPRAAWICSSLPCVVRAVTGIDTPVIAILLPLVTMTILGWAIYFRRLVLRMPYDISWAIPLGLLIAPYGWTYDQSLCVVSSFLVIFGVVNHASFTRAAGAFFIWNLGAALYYLEIAQFQRDMWWYPIGPLALSLSLRFNAEDSSVPVLQPHPKVIERL